MLKFKVIIICLVIWVQIAYLGAQTGQDEGPVTQWPVSDALMFGAMLPNHGGVNLLTKDKQVELFRTPMLLGLSYMTPLNKDGFNYYLNFDLFFGGNSDYEYLKILANAGVGLSYSLRFSVFQPDSVTLSKMKLDLLIGALVSAKLEAWGSPVKSDDFSDTSLADESGFVAAGGAYFSQDALTIGLSGGAQFSYLLTDHLALTLGYRYVYHFPVQSYTEFIDPDAYPLNSTWGGNSLVGLGIVFSMGSLSGGGQAP